MTAWPGQRLSHRDDHRARARLLREDLGRDLGRRPTGTEYRIVRQQLAALRRAEQQEDREAAGTARGMRVFR